jgi:hypothetical protein
VIVLALAALVWFTVFTAFPNGARAGTEPSTPTTESSTTTSQTPTTTEPPTTVTTQRSSTTTAPPRTTSTPSTVRQSTTSTEAPPESVAPTSEAPAPEIVTDDTLPRRAGATADDGLSTDAKLAMVIAGLAAVGVLIGVLTFLYWRHTRPQQYLTALDALADVEQKVPKDGAQIPTGENVTVPAGVGAGAAAAGARGASSSASDASSTQTQAFRIIDPAPSPDASTPPLGTPTVEPTTPESRKVDPPKADEPTSLDEPTVITTMEDLQQAPAEDGDGER